MTKEQIEKYEYCKKHLEDISNTYRKISFNKQKYSCSRNSPNIEHVLDTIHREMYDNIIDAFNVAEEKIKKLIQEI